MLNLTQKYFVGYNLLVKIRVFVGYGLFLKWVICKMGLNPYTLKNHRPQLIFKTSPLTKTVF